MVTCIYISGEVCMKKPNRVLEGFAVTMYQRGCNCVEVTEAFLSKCVLVCDRGGKSFMKPL